MRWIIATVVPSTVVSSSICMKSTIATSLTATSALSNHNHNVLDDLELSQKLSIILVCLSMMRLLRLFMFHS